MRDTTETQDKTNKHKQSTIHRGGKPKIKNKTNQITKTKKTWDKSNNNRKTIHKQQTHRTQHEQTHDNQTRHTQTQNVDQQYTNNQHKGNVPQCMQYTYTKSQKRSHENNLTTKYA